MKKLKFKIGDVVLVCGTSHSFRDQAPGAFNFKREIAKPTLNEPKLMIVCGGSWLCEGFGTLGSYYGQGTFKTTKKHFVYLLRESFTAKPVKAMEDQLEEIDWDKQSCFLTNFPFQKGLSAFLCKEVSDYMKHEYETHPEYFQRDSKGRFTKV